MNYRLTLTMITGETRIFLRINASEKWDIVEGIAKGEGVMELSSVHRQSFVFPFRNVLFAEFLET